MRDMIFMQLLLVSVSTGAIALVIKVLSGKISKAYTAGWKYWLWFVLAVRLLIPWSPSLPIQLIEIDMQRVDGSVAMQVPQAVEGTTDLLNETDIDILPEEKETLITNDFFTVDEEMQKQEDNVSNYVPSEGRIPKQTDVPNVVDGKEHEALGWKDLLHIAEGVWLLGTLIYLGYHTMANILFCRKTLRWSEAVSTERKAYMRAVMDKDTSDSKWLMILERVEVLSNSQVNSPMLIGLLHGKLLLPQKEYAEKELRFVLYHELTHYLRKDLWYKALLLLVNAVHWFNPLVHLMCKEAENDLECSCDSVVMKAAGGTERRNYADMILDIAAEERLGRHTLTSSFRGGKEELKKRLFNILDSSKKRRGILLFGVIGCVALLVGGLVHFSLEKNDSTEQVDTFNWYSHTKEMYTISEEVLGLDNVAVWMEYEEASSKGEVVKYIGAHNSDNDAWTVGEGGMLPGLGDGDWYCVTVDGVEYIYAKYDHREEYELFAYAITKEECVLGNGLHIGMTREQVKELCPGILDAKLEEEEGMDIAWNGIAYPGCWDDNFEYAMILDIDDGIKENPQIFLALMMQEDKVCAMTPYAPITDKLVLPRKPGEDSVTEPQEEPTEEPAPTEQPEFIGEQQAVLTEEYELIYEDINMFRSGTTGSYFKYKNTYADLYMRRLQDDTKEYIELSLWAPQQEIWRTMNNDYIEDAPLFWLEASKNLTLEQGQCYYVVELDGIVYLMRYCVENASNVVTMSYKVFGVSCNIDSPYYYLGHETPYDAGSISIYLASSSAVDPDVSFPIEQMTAFADTVKGYMEKGHMVASTLHGVFEFGTSADRENPISPYLYDIFPWIPKLVTQHGINMEGIDSSKKLLTVLQNALLTATSVTMPNVVVDGSNFITGDYYSGSDESYLTVHMTEDGSYEGTLLIDNALIADFVGNYDNGILTAMEIVNYPEQLPCEMEISFQNGKATVTITADSEWSYPVEVGDTLTLDRNQKPEEFDYLRNAEYSVRE